MQWRQRYQVARIQIRSNKSAAAAACGVIRARNLPMQSALADGRTGRWARGRRSCARARPSTKHNCIFADWSAKRNAQTGKKGREREREKERERKRERERERDSHPGESAHRNPVGGGGLGVIVAVPFEGHSAQSLPRVMQRIDPPRTPLPPPDPVMISSITA